MLMEMIIIIIINMYDDIFPVSFSPLVPSVLWRTFTVYRVTANDA